MIDEELQQWFSHTEMQKNVVLTMMVGAHTLRNNFRV